MIGYIANKVEQLSVIEKSTFFRKCSSQIKNDWKEIETVNYWQAWAVKRLIVNHQYKIIYCAIPKNASSSLMKSMISLDATKKTEKIINSSRDTIRKYVELNYALSTYSYFEAQKIINSDYFKFTVVRNPWTRLVSTYVNLFVRLHEHGNINDLVKSAVKYIHGEEPKDKQSININFKDFVEYLVAEENRNLDQHCIPQYLFLGDLKYNFIARMENLSEDLAYLQGKLGISLDLPKLNVTKYSSSPTAEQNNVSEFLPSELRKHVDKSPNYQAFYTPELIDLVRQRYEKDISLFNYSFDS